MRIHPIMVNNKSLTTNNGHKQNFNGHWETQPIERFVDYIDPKRIKRVYIPDGEEDAYQIAAAWKQETGLTPIDWVKNTNPYNQSENPVEYEIYGQPYIPIPVLKASAKMKPTNDDDEISRIEKYVEMAKLAGQENDKEEQQIYENKMANEMKTIKSVKFTRAAAMVIDSYKYRLGTNTMYKQYYS